MHTCTHAHVRVSIYVYIYICMYVRIHTYMYIYMYMYIYIMHICNYEEIEIERERERELFTDTYMHTYAHTCLLRTCLHMHIQNICTHARVWTKQSAGQQSGVMQSAVSHVSIIQHILRRSFSISVLEQALKNMLFIVVSGSVCVCVCVFVLCTRRQTAWMDRDRFTCLQRLGRCVSGVWVVHKSHSSHMHIHIYKYIYVYVLYIHIYIKYIYIYIYSTCLIAVCSIQCVHLLYNCFSDFVVDGVCTYMYWLFPTQSLCYAQILDQKPYPWTYVMFNVCQWCSVIDVLWPSTTHTHTLTKKMQIFSGSSSVSIAFMVTGWESRSTNQSNQPWIKHPSETPRLVVLHLWLSLPHSLRLSSTIACPFSFAFPSPAAFPPPLHFDVDRRTWISLRGF